MERNVMKNHSMAPSQNIKRQELETRVRPIRTDAPIPETVTATTVPESAFPAVIATTYNIDQLYNLDINILNPDPDQPRKGFDPVEQANLAASITKLGINNPILGRQDEEGKVFVIAGERRLRAAKEAGLKLVPVLFKSGRTAEIAIIDNMQRSDLSPVEEAEALEKLMNNFGYKQVELSQIVNRAQSTICEIIALNSLPLAVKDEIRGDKTFTRAELLTIVVNKDQKSSDEMLQIFKLLKNKKSQVKSASEGILKQIESFSAKIPKFYLAPLSASEHGTIRKSLDDLVQVINDKFSTV